MNKFSFNTFRHSLPEDNDKVVTTIVKLLNIWERKAAMLNTCIIVLGFFGVTGSIFVTAFIFDSNIFSFMTASQTKLLMRSASVISSTALVINTSFDVIGKKNKFRNGWRFLNTAYLNYLNGSIGKQELIEAYDKGEKIIGDLKFSYNFEHINNENGN
jgi:hypothetical protein